MSYRSCLLSLNHCLTLYSQSPIRRLFIPLALLLSLFLGTTLLAYRAFAIAESPSPTTTICREERTRREWRTLSHFEKGDYIQAVNCLSSITSDKIQSGTLYDEFAWLHAGIGSWCHHSASFLPWHRYTLLLYEETLREHCGFEGDLP